MPSPECGSFKDVPGPMVVIIDSCTIEQARVAGKAMAQAAGITGRFCSGTIEQVCQKERTRLHGRAE